ncbi:MAG: hypothetical protein SFV81_24745 [Pirellulaceae bacterium]|nr:hypothetical protein [Pirellulaceae bacterium]
MSVLPPQAAKRFKRWLFRVALIVLALLLIFSVVLWEKLYHAYPQRLPENVANSEFKYGSIGIEEPGGIPYWIWLTLPQIFPEHLPGPGGYTSLGILWEPGSEMPIGFSKRRIGYDRVGLNCALCHTGSYRLAQDEQRTSTTNIMVGAPATKFDTQGYLQFLTACANDARFNADTILGAIEYNTKLSALDKAIYRYVLIPGTQKALIAQGKAALWMKPRPPWGPGRIDPFNPVKFGMLKMDPKDDSTVGNSDMMPLWAMSARKSLDDGFHLHWDGLSTNLLDCSLAGALGDGATRKSLPVEQIEKLVEEIKRLPAPLWPLDIDEKLASEGGKLFAEHCARCHGMDGAQTNKPLTFSEIANGALNAHATDPNRLAMWNVTDSQGRTPHEIYNDFGNGYFWDLDSFRATKGYVSVPLNGIWARGPYLHNGSVPTLMDLLNPPLSPAATKAMLDSGDSQLFEALTDELATTARPRPSQADANKARERTHKFVQAVVAQARERGVRPPVFLRGCDVLDATNVGFVADGSVPVGRNGLFLYATFIQGNSNAGHLWGTELTKEQKVAIVEFLKSIPKSSGVTNVK